MAVGTCCTDRTLAATTTIELGDANPVATGSAKGVMLIGDDGIIECMRSDSTCTNTGNHYKTANGLQAYAWANNNVQGITNKCAGLPVDESIKTVLVYCGDVDAPTTNDYSNLITQLRVKFPLAKITIHLCESSDANIAISALSGVDVIDLRESAQTEDSKMVPEDANAWRNKILTHYTGATSDVINTTSNGSVSIDLDATTSTTGRTSTSTTTVDDETQTITSNGTSSTTATSTTTGTATGDIEGTSTSTISNAGTFNPMVTVVHSMNAKFASENAKVYYMPTLDELPLDMQAFIESGAYDSTSMYHGFAAAYTGLYDIESKTQQYSNDTVYYNTTPMVYKGVNATRALEVMGYDLLLTDEECKVWVDAGKVKAKYETTEISDTITLETAIMDIYKALGQSCYQYNYAFLPDSTLNPETSPLQKEISQALGNGGTRWDNSEGACYVFTTRTNPDLYWNRAETDRIFTTVQEKYSTYQLVSPSDVPTLAEYCQLLSGMLQTYGEPVMTEEEETLLLQVYGANMPTYISDAEQLNAIKYLIAKGIFNFTEKKDYAWASPLTQEDLWSTLMAVYDKDSRATFKDVQITTDASLVEAGYYPVGIDHDSTFVTGMSYIPVTNAESYYDYVVECKYFGTDADPALGCTLNGNQPGDDPNDTEVKYREGVSANVKYAGLVSAGGRRFYHFKVSKKVDGGFDIALSSDVKMNIQSHIGGVVIDTEYKDDKSYGNPKLLQFDDDNLTIKFDEAVAQYWADSTREKQSTVLDVNTGTVSESVDGSINAFVYLEDNDDIPILLEISSNTVQRLGECSINSVALDVSILSAVGGEQTCGSAKIKRLDNGNSNTTATFEVTGFKTYDEFRDHVRFDTVSAITYDGYRKDSSSLLVPLRYLQAVGIVKEAIQGSNCVQLRTARNTIYIDNKKKYIINGTGVYQAQSGATLYFKDGSGNIYIDYRAALGWATQYLDISNVQEGTVSLTYKTVTPDKVREKRVIGMADEIDSTSSETVDSCIINGTDYMLLNSLYPLANYFVFYTNEDAVGVPRDTLVVIKPNCPYWKDTAVAENTYDDTSIRKYVKENTGVSITSDHVKVYAYILSRTTAQDGSNPAGIIYSPEYGYLYSPQEWNGNTIAQYFNPAVNTEDPNSPVAANFSNDILTLPFAAKDGNWYGLNFNMFTCNGDKLPYGYMPVRYTAGADENSTEVCKFTGSSWDKTSDVGNIRGSTVEIQPAPVGVQWSLSSMVKPIKFSTAWNDDKTVFYYGAMRMQKDGNSLSCGSIDLHVDDTYTFTLLRQTMTSRQVTVNSDRMLTYDPLSNITLADLEVNEGAELNQFDWVGHDLQETLNTTDNFLTKFTVFVIQVIPRIVVYICILLIALALVTNVKPWVLFCDKFVDIYSVLTFGRHNVHTIDMRGIFFSSMIGIGVFWLFMDGSVFQLFGWLARAVVGIAVR